MSIANCDSIPLGRPVPADVHFPGEQRPRQLNFICSRRDYLTPAGARGRSRCGALRPTRTLAAMALVTVPGPWLEMPSGDRTLKIHLTNNLAEPVSIVIPGQAAVTTPVRFTDGQGRLRVKSFTHETPLARPARTSGPTSARNVPVQQWYAPGRASPDGLYGASEELRHRDRVSGRAYDQEIVLFLSEIDPALHAAVATELRAVRRSGREHDKHHHYDPKYS